MSPRVIGLSNRNLAKQSQQEEESSHLFIVQHPDKV